MWYQRQVSVIERLNHLNLEVSQGKVVNTKENINIKCRISPLEEHDWHSSHSQLNVVVDLIYNFFINWSKRQEELDLKIESLYKEYQDCVNKYSQINSKIELLLQKIEESKNNLNIISGNSDYIKEEITSVRKNLTGFLNKISLGKESLLISECSKTEQDIIEVKGLVEEVKELILDCNNEIILASPEIIQSNKSLNSEKWKYLKDSLEKIRQSN